MAQDSSSSIVAQRCQKVGHPWSRLLGISLFFSFFLLNIKYSIAWLYHPFTHLSVDRHLDSSHLAVITNNTMTIIKQVFIFMYLNFSWIYVYPGVEMLDQSAISHLTEKLPNLSKVTVPFNVLTSTVWGFKFLHTPLVFAIPMSVKWDFTMVLICVTLITKVKYLFMCLLAIQCIYSLEKCVIRSSPCGFFFFFLRFYLFIRERGRREKKRERNFDVWEIHWLVASHIPSTGDLAHNPGTPGMFADR